LTSVNRIAALSSATSLVPRRPVGGRTEGVSHLRPEVPGGPPAIRCSPRRARDEHAPARAGPSHLGRDRSVSYLPCLTACPGRPDRAPSTGHQSRPRLSPRRAAGPAWTASASGFGRPRPGGLGDGLAERKNRRLSAPCCKLLTPIHAATNLSPRHPTPAPIRFPDLLTRLPGLTPVRRLSHRSQGSWTGQAPWHLCWPMVGLCHEHHVRASHRNRLAGGLPEPTAY